MHGDQVAVALMERFHFQHCLWSIRECEAAGSRYFDRGRAGWMIGRFCMMGRMAEKKIIVVAGATGAQGGGLVRAICADPSGSFQARALTRNPNSEKARALAELGAEVVPVEIEDTAALRRACEGAYGLYCVTFFWDHFSPEKEQAQAASMVSAAMDAELRHVIWSTLEDTRILVPLSDDRMPTLMGRYKVPHFDAKGESDHLFSDAMLPTTFLLTSFYWDNFIYFGMGPKKGADGKYAITLPMGDRKLPGIAAEDIGRCAYGVFQRPELIGRRVGIAGEHLSGAEMAAAFSKALGVEVVYQAVPPSVYRSFGFPGAEDLGNMFQYKHDFEGEFRAPRSVEQSRELNPRLQSFAQWLEANKSLIPLV